MQLIDGNAIARQILGELKTKVAALAGVTPHVAFVRVGEDPASVSYVNKKQATAAELGMKATTRVFPETVTKEELFAHLDALNADPTVHGVLVQAPLPKHLPETEVFNRVSPDKERGRLQHDQHRAPRAGASGTPSPRARRRGRDPSS